MATLFLQDSDATILVADILAFSELAKKKGAAIELAITLSRFYEHVAAQVKAEGGRVVKLCGDGVLCAFVGVADHRARALRAVAKLVGTRDSMNELARAGHMPIIDYTVVAGSGRVLAGDLGAEKLQGFDVIGATVNRVFRLSSLATKRRASNLVEGTTVDAVPASDRPQGLAAVEGAVLDDSGLEGEQVTLFSLAS